MKRILLLAVVMTWLPLTSHAYTADQLYRWCSADMQSNPSEAGLCVGYVAGVWHTTSFVESLSKEQTLGICVPPQAKVSDVKTLFLQWARANPEKRSWQASDVLTLLLRQSYPCRG